MTATRKLEEDMTKTIGHGQPSETPRTQRANNALKEAHRKVDARMPYWCAFVFLTMRMNVNNISNTAILNKEEGTDIRKQLGNLSSSQWAWALSIFWCPHMLFEPVATLMLKCFSPSIWMSWIMFTWGVVSICQAATHNYSGILACRFFLGMAEVGFFPSVLYHLSLWYPAHRLPLRIVFLYACGMSTGTVSGLLAYALFIIEGYPQTVDFLSEDECAAILADLPQQAPTMRAKTFDTDQTKSLSKSTTFLSFLMIWTTHDIGGWGMSFVLPTVIYELGISNTAVSQVLTIPPFALVFLILISLAYFIHHGYLSPWVAGLGVEGIQIVCYILLINVKQPVAKYIFIMIATAASQSSFAIIWPERVRVAKGTTTAGLAIGMSNASGQLMGILGPQIYQPKFGPTYRISYACSIALIAMCLGAVLSTWHFVRKGDVKGMALQKTEDGVLVA
ncbi:hypothetical protein AA0111_g448 [Alternaria arborescens]|uniref:hypothetical protein n=1 Tax=Alternaria arborescens TaxID=156630 RepID=UPI0010752284|nr:hypothetical protein AA0111_g448 [Alternaria arborescens]RYO43405.1 hypothetical protein AA0111_g448 [Alternaria arborescens]